MNLSYLSGSRIYDYYLKILSHFGLVRLRHIKNPSLNLGNAQRPKISDCLGTYHGIWQITSSSKENSKQELEHKYFRSNKIKTEIITFNGLHKRIAVCASEFNCHWHWHSAVNGLERKCRKKDIKHRRSQSENNVSSIRADILRIGLS